MASGAEPTDRLVLDTTGYSHFRAGRAEALDWIAEATVVTVPVIVLGELDAAFRCGTRFEENTRSLEEFLMEPFVEVAEVDRAVARRYGALVAELRRNGTPIPVNDIWIAATTMTVGGRLLTFDRDFERVPALDCVVLR